VQKDKCCRSKEFGPDTGLFEKSGFGFSLYEKIGKIDILIFMKYYSLYFLGLQMKEAIQVLGEAYSPPWRASSTSTHEIFSSGYFELLRSRSTDPIESGSPTWKI
jgi:hypothetical protein